MTASGTLRSGWRVLMADPDRILVPTIAVSVPAIALHVVIQHLVGVWVAGTQECVRTFGARSLLAQCGPSNGRAQLALLVGLFAFLVLGHLVVVGINRAALDAIDGVAVRGPFAAWNLRSTLPTALLLGAVLTISTLMLLLPGLVVAFFTRYAMLFAADGHRPVAAVLASCRLVGARFGSELGFAFRSSAVLLLGVLALGIGLYVAVPVVLIAQAQRYRATGYRQSGYRQAGSARPVGVEPEHRPA